jgi:Family of unknown function (DUF5522)
MNQKEQPQANVVKKALVQGEHYYINENGNWVFTEIYHKLRGYCCKNGCKHCPYGNTKNPK